MAQHFAFEIIGQVFYEWFPIFFLTYIHTQWILNPQPPPRIYKGKRCQFKLEFIGKWFSPINFSICTTAYKLPKN